MRLTAFVNILASNREDWELQLAFAEQLDGLSGIELWIEHDLLPEDIKWLRARLKTMGVAVAIHAPFVGVALASHVDTLRRASVDRVLSAARVGEALSAEVITCHSGQVGAWIDQPSGLRTLARSLAEIVGGTDLTVAIENMPARSGGSRELVTNVSDLLYLVEAVDRLGVTLDLGHLLQNSNDPAAEIAAVGHHIRHIHIHDGISGGRAHMTLGTGQLDVRAVIDALTDSSVMVSLETLGEEDTKKSWDYLRANINTSMLA